MAHELENDPVTGKIPLFYYGKLPWHGLGQTLPENRPATAAEVLQLTGLGWEVEKQQAYVRLNEQFYPVFNTEVVVRKDTVGVPGVEPIILTTNGNTVTAQYRPLQNLEAFSFFDSIVGEGKAIYHSAGALRKGDRIWLLAKLPESMGILGVDQIDPYILLTNSHDGTGAIQVMLTVVRVICANTLRLAMTSGMRDFRIRHSASAAQKLREVADLMGIVSREVKDTEEVFTRMARKQLSAAGLQAYFEAVYPPPVAEPDAKIPERTSKNYSERMKTLTAIFEQGSGGKLETTTGTVFGAFSAVTDYVDHYGRASNASTRMESVLTGHGDGIKQRALQLATELVTA